MQKRNRWMPNGLGVFTSTVYLFLYAPIIVLVVLSFNNSRFSAIWQGFSWRWYQLAYKDTELIASLRMSLIIATLTTIIATLIGTAAAIALARYRWAYRQATESLVYLPVIIPEIVIGFASAALFGLVGFKFGISTVVIAHVAFAVSYVIFVVRARVAGFDRRLEDAAMDLGATPIQTFFRVTLPIILPGIISAALLVFTISLDDFVITSFVAGPGSATLPIKIYSMVKTGVTPEINAISTILLLVTILLVFVSEKLSTGKSSKWVGVAGLAAIGILTFFAFGGQSKSTKGGELNIFIWSNYLPENVVQEFEEKFGTKLNIELYDSNEALLAKLQSGGATYDIIVPSDYMVSVLKAQGLIDEINLDAIPNFSNLDSQFVGLPYDPTNQYSIAYMWGTTGIAYRKDKIPEAIDSWGALLDGKYKDRIAMLDDVRETLGAMLKYQGYSLNSKNETEISTAAKLLSQQKPLVKAYDSGGFDQMLLSGDVWITQAYSGQIAKVMNENQNIGYVVPKEGCTIFVDNLCIPKSSKNKELALEFINFVLDQRVAAEITNGTGFSSPNRAARPLIKPELLTNEAAYPPKELLERCEFIEELGELINIYDRLWTQIKSE